MWTGGEVVQKNGSFFSEWTSFSFSRWQGQRVTWANSFLWTPHPPSPQTGQGLGFQTTQGTKPQHLACCPGVGSWLGGSSILLLWVRHWHPFVIRFCCALGLCGPHNYLLGGDSLPALRRVGWGEQVMEKESSCHAFSPPLVHAGKDTVLYHLPSCSYLSSLKDFKLFVIVKAHIYYRNFRIYNKVCRRSSPPTLHSLIQQV